MEYDEFEPKPTWRETATQLAYRLLPYVAASLVLALLVAAACRMAAKVENRGASDPWGNIIENAIRAGKNPALGQ